jgi:RHS repeat-associated protein
VHPDHLGSTNVVTDEGGNLVQTLDYYPYGSTRISDATSTNQLRKYIGQFADQQTGLDYLNARYYEPNRAQFVTQDPVFWEIGQTQDGMQVLTNPQQANSYSYAGDNPITNKDPTGRFWWVGFYDWRGYDGWKGAGMKALEVFGGHTRAMNAIAQNAQNVNNLSARNGVNPALTNAIIYEEQSHLTPDETPTFKREQIAPTWEPSGKDGGVGLMQVNGANGQQYGGYSKWELANYPMLNIDSGTKVLAGIQKNYNTKSPATTGTVYNGSPAYGQRINAQMTNPNYNTNILIAGLSALVSKLSSLVGEVCT